MEASPMCEQALVTGTIIASEDLLNDKRTHNQVMTEQQGVRSMLFITLYVQTNRVGLLLVGSTIPRKFTEHNLRLAELLSTQVAVTITNSRLYEQMSESLRAQQRLQLQRERLTAITLAVYQASSLDESLKRLVDLAPAALEMDLCTVSLISEDGAAMCAAAATAPFESLIGKRFEIAGRNAEKVLESRQMLVIDDGAADQSIHEELRKHVRVGSIVYIPLFESDGRPLGLLLLIRHTPGSFSDEQLRLAQVFASRASGAIESARLYQQTRRDAETKAMLLRELNHRVKNNLAGIVGLLSTKPEGLGFPPQAEQWLDRVVDRISIMGRAHELFVGGPQTIGLAELIDQLLPTLSIVKPAGVRVVKELDGVSVTLSTERAVALAMVLHELCCNAIAHGLGDRGTIVIRAHSHTTGVVIEVADDGAGLPRQVESKGHAGVAVNLKMPSGRGASTEVFANKGWGLRLVEGLVSRELRGRFTMCNSPDLNGGTIARVEFPISSENERSRNP
ncbi:MAG: GAF domain-containing protein [Chthoniobacterales bacterium]|nr:GAF domain-containing protein [Chthoniobacterales bacterium]